MPSALEAVQLTAPPGRRREQLADEEPTNSRDESLKTPASSGQTGEPPRERASVRDLYKPEGEGHFFADLARSPWFENTTLAVITVNAFWIAYDTDNNDSDNILDADVGFQVAENLFCFFFTGEWFVRFMAYESKWDTLKDHWFIFDSGLVLTMVIETWIMLVVLAASSSRGNNSLGGLTILRLLRLMRLSRITRLMRMMPEMMIMIQGMLSATRSVCITFFLLLIMIYVFAIALVQLTKESEVGGAHFDSVPSAMYTLLVEGIIPDQGTMLETLGGEKWYAGLIFIVFVVLATFTMINMLIGILCEVACRVAATEKEKMDIDLLRSKLLSIISESVDRNGDNLISKIEFLGIAANPAACKALRAVGVDARDLVEHADFIFDTVDADGLYAERRLDFTSFMQVLLKFRGTNAATIKDITNLRKFVQDSISSLERSINQGSLRRTHLTPTASAGSMIAPGINSMAQGDAKQLTTSQEVLACVSGSTQPVDLADDRTQALMRLPDEVEDLRVRMDRLESLMEQVIQGQLQMQGIMKERLPPGGLKLDALLLAEQPQA